LYSKETAGNSLKRDQSEDQEDSAGSEFRDADATGDNFLYVYEYRCMYICMNIRIDICICICKYIYMYMHIYMHIYVCMYVYMYVSVGDKFRDADTTGDNI
jgi:hypothetical protein